MRDHLKSRVLTLALLAAPLAALFITVGGIAPAQASDRRPAATVKVVSSVVEKSTVSSRYIEKSKAISSCSVGRTGGTCTIARGKTASRTIQVSLGVTKQMVAGSFGFSAASSVSTTVACNSPKMKAGEVWRAYAVGSRYRYKAKKVTMIGYVVAKTEKSGWLYAFNPRAADIHCQ